MLDGGRDPAGRVRLVAWGDPRERTTPPDATWPGRLPAPSPATVLDRPVPAQVFDAEGRPVGTTGREQVTAAPCRLSIAGGPRRDIVAWAGPWPAAAGRRRPGPRRARLQLVLAAEGDGPPEAVLAYCAGTENPLWTVEGVYD